MQTVWHQQLETTKSKRYRKLKQQKTKLFLRKESITTRTPFAPKVTDRGLLVAKTKQREKQKKLQQKR